MSVKQCFFSHEEFPEKGPAIGGFVNHYCVYSGRKNV